MMGLTHQINSIVLRRGRIWNAGTIMNNYRMLSVVMLSLSLLGCTIATKYQSLNSLESLTGGYAERKISPGIWEVDFVANGDTTYETAQTYWLYRCAELTLSKGYQGFEIVSDLRLTQMNSGVPMFTRVSSGGMIFIPMYEDNSAKPNISAQIRFLNLPFTTVLSRVFDAAALKAALDPYVNGEKCEGGNVCPHVHVYLHPDAR